MFKQSFKIVPKIIRKSTNIAPKIDQNCSKINQNRSQGPLGELWRPSWPQDGSRGQHRLQNLVRWTPLDVEVGGPNPPKIDPKRIEKGIIFLISFWIDFWSDLLPTWHQLGSQNPPKMEPSRLQKPSKRQTSEIRKTLKNNWFLKFFGGLGVPSWSKNPPKMSPRGHQKQDEILNRFFNPAGCGRRPYKNPIRAK